MWTCENCGRPVEDLLNQCAACGAVRRTPKKVLPERLIVTILKRKMRDRFFWLICGLVIFGLVGVPWGLNQIQKSLARTPEAAGKEIKPEVRKKMETMIDKLLPEKLEWGREVLRRKLPTRFPEELALEVNKPRAEIKYENKQGTSASYRVPVSYHFVAAKELTYIWQSVTFYFEIRNGDWSMIGDRWLRESEVDFE